MSPADSIRVAVALTALKFKPRAQSFESYILDLQSLFLLPTNPITTALTHEDLLWRARALLLESKLSDLQANFEVTKSQIASLRLADVTASDTTPKAAATKKKKRKPAQEVTPVRDTKRVRLEDIISGSTRRSDICEISSPLSTSSAFSALQNLTSSADTIQHPFSLLFAITHRALESLGQKFQLSLSRTSKQEPLSSVAKMTRNLLNVLLTDSFPLLIGMLKQKRKRPIDMDIANLESLFGVLVADILVPAVRSFVPLSKSMLLALLPKQTGKTHQYGGDDGRGETFLLLQQTLSDIDNLGSHSVIDDGVIGLKLILSLEAARQLSSGCYEEDPGLDQRGCKDGNSGCAEGGNGVENRIDRLASKEARWYLCSILHLTLERISREGRDSTTNRVLHEEILKTLCALARAPPSDPLKDGYEVTCASVRSEEDRTDSRGDRFTCQILRDGIGEGMVLALVEKASVYLSGCDVDVVISN